jgi:hypothetical protein
MSNNTTNDMFILATRKKFRFESTKGSLTVEDVFDLNLTALDKIAVALDDKIQQLGRKTFIDKRPASSTDLETQLEIIKYVIETKQKEDEERKLKQVKAEQKEFLKTLREKKQLAQLEGMSLEEIEKQLASLE